MPGSSISLDKEAMAALLQARARLAEQLGFRPSYSQVIKHLVRKARP